MTRSASYKLGIESEIYKMAAEKWKTIEFFQSENDKAPKLGVSISDFIYRSFHKTRV